MQEDIAKENHFYHGRQQAKRVGVEKERASLDTVTSLKPIPSVRTYLLNFCHLSKIQQSQGYSLAARVLAQQHKV